MLEVLRIKTQFGIFSIVIKGGDTVVFSCFGDKGTVVKKFPSEKLKIISNHEYKDILVNFFNGKKVDLSFIKTEFMGTEFQKKVWTQIKKVKYANTLSYKDIAKASKNERAVRAIGTICGKNIIPIIIPCHRVIKSDGSLGEYVYGKSLKKKLIELENS